MNINHFFILTMTEIMLHHFIKLKVSTVLVSLQELASIWPTLFDMFDQMHSSPVAKLMNLGLPKSNDLRLPYFVFLKKLWSPKIELKLNLVQTL